MSGIVGIAQTGRTTTVRRTLEKLVHRGHAIEIIETDSTTLGVTYSPYQAQAAERLKKSHIAWDEAGEGHFAMAACSEILLKRDPIGVAPLYYGWENANRVI